MTSFEAMKLGDILGGKYKLTQEIGKGAMGAVWAAHDLESARSVAVKFILPQKKDWVAKDLRHRLLREANACGKLCHRNVVQIYAVAETADGEPFLVLELLHGQTVAQLLDVKRSIEPAMAARIIGEAASGLAAAHSAQVIHRDLKPENLYLHREEGMPESEFVLKILDFGVCKTFDRVDGLVTQAYTAVGTPPYMSPEQVAMRKDVDHRTDIWSLGIVLYELLTGARPFSGTVEEVVRQIAFTPVPPPSAKVREVSPELDLVVATCTAPKREKRYSNAQDLANALFAIAETYRRAQRNIPVVVRIPAAPISASSRTPDVMPGAASSAQPSEAMPLPIALPTKPAPSSPAEDDLGTAPTMPLTRRNLSAALQASRRDEDSSGTQVLDASHVLESPEPPWKQEMKEALAARRQVVGDMNVLQFNESAVGHTQLFMPEVRPSAPRQSITDKAPPTAEETTAGTTMPSPHAMGTPVQRRRESKVLLGAVGVVIVATLVVATIWAMSQEKPDEPAKASVPEASAAAATSVPTQPEKVTPPAEAPAPPDVVIPESKKTGKIENGRREISTGPKSPTAPRAGVTGGANKPGPGNPYVSQTPATKVPGGTSNSGKKPCKPTVFNRCPK